MQANDIDEPHPAVLVVDDAAQRHQQAAERRLAEHGMSGAATERAATDLLVNSRITLNFHPDRRDVQGRTVAAGLFADGRYRSQFETGISNGGRFAVPGGARPRWESTLFGGVYDDEAITRPVYGALDLFNDPYGGAPRFGSCFVVLEHHCLDRVTLCVGDSHLGPADLGTFRRPMSILAGVVDACSTPDGFGRDLSVNDLLDRLASSSGLARSERALDHYVEAQVHGGVDLERDVNAVVLDPSFERTAVERDIEAAAVRYGFELDWNEGSELRPEDVPPEFRGSDMAALGRGAARADGLVDAAAIGRALSDVPFTLPSVAGDPEASPQQRYKKLWHCCLEFGTPRE